MTDHVFISYSTVDALDISHKLVVKLEGGENQYPDTWFDKLAKCDSEGLLEGVREAVEGKES